MREYPSLSKSVKVEYKNFSLSPPPRQIQSNTLSSKVIQHSYTPPRRTKLKSKVSVSWICKLFLNRITEVKIRIWKHASTYFFPFLRVYNFSVISKYKKKSHIFSIQIFHSNHTPLTPKWTSIFVYAKKYSKSLSLYWSRSLSGTNNKKQSKTHQFSS